MSKPPLYLRNLSSIYPGEFAPREGRERRLLRRVKQARGKSVSPLPVIKDKAGHYSIELFVPGFKRDDFFVSSDGQKISVIAAYEPAAKLPSGLQLASELNEHFVQTDIALPADADTDFVVAEYKDDKLSISLHKDGASKKTHESRIIVY